MIPTPSTARPRSSASPKKNSLARRLGFDDKNQLAIERINTQVTEAANQQAIAQTVVNALTTRQAAAKTLLSAAQDKALTAETSFMDGQVAAQTALKSLVQAQDALAQAGSIREAVQHVYAQAYRVGQQTVAAAQALDLFARSVTSRKAKNEYISTNVVGGIDDMQTEAQSALSAVILAVQSSMIALARADEAVAAAQALVREATHVLTVLIPPPADLESAEVTEHYGAITNLRDLTLYEGNPPSIAALARSIAAPPPQDATNGLLYLLDAMKDITGSQRDELNALNGEISMELNAGQHRLEQKSRLSNSLQAALSAALAALG